MTGVQTCALRSAFAGAGGYIHILCGKLKTWVMDLKMNTAVRALTFSDEITLISSGLDANVYIWDLRQSRGHCVQKFAHDDGSCTSSVAVSNSGSNSQYLAVGGESGVVSIFNTSDSFLAAHTRSSHKNCLGLFLPPTPIKSVMNLTMKLTKLAFHPSGQMLAIASNQVL